MVFNSEENQKQGSEFAQGATMTDETHIKLWWLVKFAKEDPAEFKDIWMKLLIFGAFWLSDPYGFFFYLQERLLRKMFSCIDLRVLHI